MIFREGYLSVETVTFGQFSESEHWGTREPAKATEPPLGEVKSPRASPIRMQLCLSRPTVYCFLALAHSPVSGPRVPEPAQDPRAETVVVCVFEAGGG